MGNFDFSKVKDVAYYKENRLEAHSDHKYYRNKDEEEAETSGYVHSLNGLWKFSYATNAESVIDGFWKEEYDCKPWADIRVPAHIQLEGYDKPQYSNVAYPWDGKAGIKPGEIPTYFNPVACYAKYFTVPENFGNGPVMISFQGVESAIALWCNGIFVGYSEDSFTPSEFDLTPFIQAGENKLAACVFKWCAGSWCEDQDFFRFSGIFRDVYLFTLPKVHLQDVKVQTLLADTFDRAELVLDTKATGNGHIKVNLLREDKKYVYREEKIKNTGFVMKSKVIADMEGNLQAENHFVIPVDKPLLWSAEEPNLYKLELEVYDNEGSLQEIIPIQVGFRRFEIADGLMKINGKRIVLKGTNRHEFSSRTGRAVSTAELWQDLVNMKQHNINAIRTCHYPNSSAIYDLCDRLGFYMIDECNLESHGSWEPAARGAAPKEEVVPGDIPEWNAVMLDRANSMYQRDKNHPAILIWSCGNEAFGGKNIYDMSQFFHKVDPGRIVQYEGIVHDRRYPDTSDVESQMYTPAKVIREILQKDRSKPFICCEYMHSMGNSTGGMFKYTDLTDEEPLYQGGFIWDYIDQCLYKKDRYGNEFLGYGGDFDDRPNDGNFSGDGICYGGERNPSPKMQEVKFNYQNITADVFEDHIKITNKNLFVDTSDFDCVVIVEREGRVLREDILMTDVEPGCSQDFPYPFLVPNQAGEYVITVSFRLKADTAWAKAGHEIAFGQGIFRKQIPENAIIADRPIKRFGELTVVDGTYNYGVRGAEFEVLFSKWSGMMTSYVYGGKELLKTAPVPNFWRAPVDNDNGNHMPLRYCQWKLASLYYSANGVDIGGTDTDAEGCVVVKSHFKFPTTPESACDMIYKIYGDGTVAVTMSMDPVEGLNDCPEFGVMFKMDADFDRMKWYGEGPEETYSDRRKGAKLGLHTTKIVENLSHYLVPQESGNHTEVRYAQITNAMGRGLLLVGDRLSLSVLPWTPHEIENAMHEYELPQIHYTVVRAALAQMGIGGDDTWGARVHDEFLLPKTGKLEFTFYIKGI